MTGRLSPLMRVRLADVRRAGPDGLKTHHGKTINALVDRGLIVAGPVPGGSICFSMFTETDAGREVKL